MRYTAISERGPSASGDYLRILWPHGATQAAGLITPRWDINLCNYWESGTVRFFGTESCLSGQYLPVFGSKGIVMLSVCKELVIK